MLSQNAQLSDLVSLIVTSTRSIEKLYSTLSPSHPEVPSLNDVEPHPLDGQLTHPDLREAIRVLEGACTQLSASVARPQHVMLNRMMQTFEASCYHVALKFKVTDILSTVSLPSPGMHIDELSRRTGVDKGKLTRILRLLVSKHVYTEVVENVFANNRLSMMLHSSNDLSSIGLFLSEESRHANCHLATVLGDAIWGRSSDPRHAPISHWLSSTQDIHNTGIFEWYEMPEGAMQGARFGRGMIGWGNGINAGAVVTEFPWHELPSHATVCDVGGGIGAISMQLLRKHPHLRIKLQDMPERVKQAKDHVWPKMFPEALGLHDANAESLVEFKAIDFLKESPIKDCDVYFMKNIILDWPDDECVTILRNIKDAMKSESRILIHEYVLAIPSIARDSPSPATPDTGDLAPPPLLPNYGAGNIRQYNLDISVMGILNSKQRTLKEFQELGERAGLRFIKVWVVGEMGLVEFRL